MDPNHSENTKRIAKNTLFLYTRVLFGMFVSLYTSRVVLNALGVENYGIYNVVGGFVGMFSIISSALSSSIGRFLTFELGAGNKKKLKEVFSTSLLIQLVLSGIILVTAETVGLWFVNYKMVIPPERLYAANWVFQASVFSFILGLLSSPYNASMIAHEKMNVFAYLGILTTLLNLLSVLFIAYAPFEFDRLIVYSLLLMSSGLMMQMIYLIYCWRNFEESRVYPKFHKQCWKEMSGFAGWNAIGCTAAIFKDQGVNILLNLFFGPVVNAARGISISVSNAVCQFSGNFMAAVSPQITKTYASQDRQYMFSLVERGSRFGYYIMLMFALPIILETPIILKIWLKQYPDNTVLFVRLVLIYSLLEILSSTLITLQVATGKIRNYQIAVGGLLMMNFPISWLVLKLGAPAYSVYIVAIAIGIGCLLLRIYFLGNMVGLSRRAYLKNVVGNVSLTSLYALVIPLLFYFIMPSGVIKLVTVIIVCLISTALSTLYVGCTSSERMFILSKINGVRTKFTKKVA